MLKLSELGTDLWKSTFIMVKPAFKWGVRTARRQLQNAARRKRRRGIGGRGTLSQS